MLDEMWTEKKRLMELRGRTDGAVSGRMESNNFV